MTSASRRELGQHLEATIPALRRFAKKLTRSPDDADDLVQSCLLRALVKSDLWQPGTNLRAWLFTMMYNLHINTIRHLKVAGIHVALEKAAIAIKPTQDTAVEFAECRRALNTLSPRSQEVIRLVAWRGLSYEQAASRLGIPTGTVRSRLSRSRHALCDLLRQSRCREEVSGFPAEPVPPLPRRIGGAGDRAYALRAP
jgi:RNA polymerase sigma-70 factor (ECF subfamily)